MYNLCDDSVVLSLTTILDYGFEAKRFHTHLSSDFICHHKVWSVFFCVVCFLRELEKTTCHVHIIEHLLQPGNSNKHQDIIIFQKKAGGHIVVVAAVFFFFFFFQLQKRAFYFRRGKLLK